MFRSAHSVAENSRFVNAGDTMNMQIFALRTDGLSARTAQILCRAADAEHAEFFREGPDRPAVCASLAANVLLRYAAARTLGVPMRAVSTARLPSGQPTLPGTGLFCSVSHTKDLCLCAVADAPIGIDAEVLRPAPMRVAERVFSDAERRQLASSDEPDRLFFTFWTRRESFVKLTGAGLRDIRAEIPPHVRTQTFRLWDAYCVSVSTFTESS